MKNKRVSSYALKSMVAMNTPSVKSVNYKIIEQLEDILLNNEEAYYVGVKDTNVIPSLYLKNLESKGYLMHTVDQMSDRGRAIDYELKNPITGRFMTGSSSGTAINVFKGLNDIGIGTDGGGSVLAPAISINLYGFLSPYICNEELSQYSKKSTDNIVFQPAIGFIAKTQYLIDKIVSETIDTSSKKSLDIVVAEPVNEYQQVVYKKVHSELNPHEIKTLSYDSSSRESLMKDIKNFDFDNNVLVTFEGPVDLFEYGDSLMGHYGDMYKEKQQKANKYYLTVVNMLGLSSIIVPTSELGVGILFMCKSEPSYISAMLDIARKISFERSELEERYFSYMNY